jgi:protein arginine kinase activator
MVQMTQIVNDSMQEISLCNACAQKCGIFESDVPHLSILKNIGSALISKMQALSFSPVCSCDGCGFSLSNYKETGFVGCPKCYSGMYDFMIKTIENLQKSTKHIGKIPGHMDDKSLNTNLNDSRESLEEAMKRAIAEERFEDAAKLRDQLRSQF